MNGKNKWMKGGGPFFSLIFIHDLGFICVLIFVGVPGYSVQG